MVRSAYVYAVDVNWSYKFADFFYGIQLVLNHNVF